MSDFTVITLRFNSGSDASPTFTGNSINFAGSSGNNELRFAQSGTGAGTTLSYTNWPFVTRPSSGTQVINQLYGFPTDGAGTQITTYDGTSAHYMQLQWNWDNTGTFAAAPQFSAFGDNTHATPSPGTQPGAQSGSPIVNGHSSDTSSTSYLKINAYGQSGNQVPSANAGGTVSVTTGSGTTGSPVGSVPATNAWLSTWQSAQGWVQYIVNGVVPSATTAGQWYWVCILYTGANMSTGTLQPVITLQYAYT